MYKAGEDRKMIDRKERKEGRRKGSTERREKEKKEEL